MLEITIGKKYLNHSGDAVEIVDTILWNRNYTAYKDTRGCIYGVTGKCLYPSGLGWDLASESHEPGLIDMDYEKDEVNLLNVLMVKLNDYHNRHITEREFRNFVAEFLDAKD